MSGWPLQPSVLGDDNACMRHDVRMTDPRLLAEVRLHEGHVVTGAVRHFYGFADGSRQPVPRPTSLRLVQYAGDEPRVYLLYCDSAGDEMTDTLHDSLEEALTQASVEFGVTRNEWTYHA